MSSWSSGGFVPSADDGNQGARGFVARLNTATNAAGLSTPAAPGSAYSGATVYNRSPAQWTRARVNFVAGYIPPIAADIYQLVPPNGTASFSFDADVIDSVMVQVVDAPAPGTIVAADAAVVAAAVVGTVDVTINLVSG
jgi:hypothetical protein